MSLRQAKAGREGITIASQYALAEREDLKMGKAKKLWARFCALAGEQAKIDFIPKIGNESERNTIIVNCFHNDGIRRIRALQVLKDLQAELQKIGLSESDFLQSVKGLK